MVAATLLAGPAGATYHTLQIEEICSNAEGTVQYVTPEPKNPSGYLPAYVARAEVGTMTITFVNGNSASYENTVTWTGQRRASQTENIMRPAFRAPGPLCQ